MYPAQELNRLARHKVVLQAKIARHRAQCVRAATRVAEPLAWLDRMLAHWRRLAPLASLAAVPLGLLLKKSSAAQPRLLGTLLRWGPIAWNVVRGLTAARPATPAPHRRPSPL